MARRPTRLKNFEAIKKMFKEYGMYWDPKVQGWAKGLKFGMTPLIKEQNRKTRAAVEDAFYTAIELEEAVRGPSLALQGNNRADRLAEKDRASLHRPRLRPIQGASR